MIKPTRLKLLSFVVLLPFLTGCGVYNSGFQCPAGKGIGCKAVGEVLDYIVEKEEGEDLFIPDKGKALLLKKEQAKKKKASKREPTKHKEDEKPLTLVKTKSGELVLVTEEEEKGQGYDATTQPSWTEAR